jgi:hypothetical protein
MHILFSSENVKERDHSEDLGVDGRYQNVHETSSNMVGKCGLDSSHLV